MGRRRATDSAFKYDLIILNGPSERAVALDLAEELKAAGLKVWFEEWYSPSPVVIKSACDHSRILLVLLSQEGVSTTWGQIESYSALFRDPTNEQRLFLPVKAEPCKLPSTIQNFQTIDLFTEKKRALKSIIQACTHFTRKVTQTHAPLGHGFKLVGKFPSRHGAFCSLFLNNTLLVTGSTRGRIESWDVCLGKKLTTWPGHDSLAQAVAISSDGRSIVSGSNDGTLKIWDIRKDICRLVLKHEGFVKSVALTRDNARIISAGGPHISLRAWRSDIGGISRRWHNIRESGEIEWDVRSIGTVNTVALSPDNSMVVSGNSAGEISLWSVATGKRQGELTGHYDSVNSIVVTKDGGRVVSGSSDGTVKLWDLGSARCLATFEGHHDDVLAVCVSADGQMAASSSWDQTIKLWDLQTGACISTYSLGKQEGKGDYLNSVFQCIALRDKENLVAGSNNGHLYMFNIEEAISRISLSKPQECYTNAKVVLIGETGVGKSGLGIRLAENRWEATESTHGMRVWQLKLTSDRFTPEMEKEIWLWDLAGQPEYRLVHQLFLDDTALALVLVNPQGDDPFQGVGDWDRALRTAVKGKIIRILVAARCDRGGPMISEGGIDQFCKANGFDRFLKTSAKTGDGCDALLKTVSDAIPWDKLPWTSTTSLFKALKSSIVNIKDAGTVLIRFIGAPAAT